MSDVRAWLRSRTVRGAAIVAGVLAVSTAAFGLPWDLDMVDSQAVKAYERLMKPLPEGVVSQPSLYSPKHFVQNYKHTDPQVATLTNPLPADEATLAQGKRMYEIYCTPCHGDGVNLGPVAAPGRVPAVPALSGPEGRMQRLTDGWVYVTIRNGSLSQIMPPYGYMMTEAEMWSIISYTRTFQNAAYNVPAPPSPAPTGNPQ